VLGMSEGGQGLDNLRRQGECVINLPGPSLWQEVERLAPTTGRQPVPEEKRAIGYRFVADKFRCAGLTSLNSWRVAPPRIAECPLQLEARLLTTHSAKHERCTLRPAFAILETQILQAHAHNDIVIPGTQHIDTTYWQPLLYVFRHYFATGPRLGHTLKAAY